MVVTPAERDGVVEIGEAAGFPRLEVVGLGPGEGPIAPFGSALVVASGERHPLVVAEEAPLSPEVEGDGVAVEDGGQDARAAGEAAARRAPLTER